MLVWSRGGLTCGRCPPSPPPASFGQVAFNEEAARKLERLAELCAAHGGHGHVYRERGFKTAAGVLRRLGVQITNIEQLQARDRRFVARKQAK